MKRVLVTLTGPTCAGKSSLEKLLILEGFGRVISTTSRPQRINELEDDYHFVSAEKFKVMNDAGEIIESNEYAGNWYGTSKQAVEDAFDRGNGLAVIVVDPNGAANLRRHFRGSDTVQVINIWVACDIEVQMLRFATERAGSLPPGRLAERLTSMFKIESKWRQSAALAGRLYDYPYLYTMQIWNAGPDMADIHVEGIKRLARRFATGVAEPMI